MMTILINDHVSEAKSGFWLVISHSGHCRLKKQMSAAFDEAGR